MNASTRPRFAAGTAGAASSPPRRGVRVLIWVVAIVAGIVLAAWAGLAIFLPPAKVRSLASAKLSAMLTREVRFADASIWLWPPVRVSVRQPALAESGGFAHGSAFEAQAVHLDLDVFKLLGRRVVVRRLVLDQPALHLALKPDGTTNFDGILEPARPGAAEPGQAAMDLAVRQLQLVNARVLMDDLRAGRRVTFRVDCTIGLRAESGGRRFATLGETRISELAFGPLAAARLSDLNQSLAKLDWRVQHDGKFDQDQKRLALSKLAIQFGKTEVNVAGVVDEPGPRARLDLRARGAGVDLGEIMGFLAAADAPAVHGVQAAGRMDFDLQLKGALGPGQRPDAIGTLNVANASFRYPGAPAAIEAVSFGARFAPDSLAIGDLSARLAGQPVHAALYASRLADPLVRFAVQGNLDLASVAPLVAPPDTKLGGRAAVDVRGSGRARDPGSVALDGSATLMGVSVESAKLPNKIDGIDGVIRFSPERASVSGFKMRAGKSSLSGEATVSRPLALMAPLDKKVAPAQVQFSMVSPYLDLSELLPVTPGAPLMPNAAGGGNVQIARLIHQKLDVRDVSARIGLEPGTLDVPDFSVHAYHGTCTGSARFDLRAPERPVFEVKSRVDSIDADALLSAWTPVKGFLHGALSTTFALSGAGMKPAEIARSISASGLAAIVGGTLGPARVLEGIARLTHIEPMQGVKFKNGKIPFRIEQGRVMTDAVTLAGPQGDWKVAGTAGFDGALDYTLSGTLPPDVVRSLDARKALAAGALTDSQGRILLDLRVTGSVRSPKVSWDSKAMRDRLAGKASEAIAEQRARIEAEVRGAAEAKTRAAQDSARAVLERVQKSASDSLRRQAQGVLRGLFEKNRPDTTKKP